MSKRTTKALRRGLGAKKKPVKAKRLGEKEKFKRRKTTDV